MADPNSEPETRFTRELDTRGMNCPLSILQTKKAMDEMVAGEVIRIVTDDAASVGNMKVYATQTGSELISSREDGAEFVFHVRKH